MNRRMLLGDPPSIRITGQDFGRIDVLLANLSTNSPPPLEFLKRELDRARVVDEDDTFAPFVRIGSRVLFRDDQGKAYRLTLSLPGEMVDAADRVSILTPVGAALLGLSAGQSIAYETRDGRIKTLTVLEISADQPPPE